MAANVDFCTFHDGDCECRAPAPVITEKDDAHLLPPPPPPPSPVAIKSDTKVDKNKEKAPANRRRKEADSKHSANTRALKLQKTVHAALAIPSKSSLLDDLATREATLKRESDGYAKLKAALPVGRRSQATQDLLLQLHKQKVTAAFEFAVASLRIASGAVWYTESVRTLDSGRFDSLRKQLDVAFVCARLNKQASEDISSNTSTRSDASHKCIESGCANSARIRCRTCDRYRCGKCYRVHLELLSWCTEGTCCVDHKHEFFPKDGSAPREPWAPWNEYEDLFPDDATLKQVQFAKAAYEVAVDWYTTIEAEPDPDATESDSDVDAITERKTAAAMVLMNLR